jgi:hypothetical protein
MYETDLLAKLSCQFPSFVVTTISLGEDIKTALLSCPTWAVPLRLAAPEFIALFGIGASAISVYNPFWNKTTPC